MRHLLILCRHGNTFNPGEKVVMVGAREDLPLTPVGKAQALAVGQALKRRGISPQRIIAGPLKRTREFAEIVSELLGTQSSVAIDTRLTELDYGAWGGLSDDEIRQQWGAETLRLWHEKARRPEGVAFTPSEAELESEARALLGECAATGGITLVVTSNGRLREFSRVLCGEARKVRTGHLCVLESTTAGVWQVVSWDCDADSFAGM